MTVSDTYSVHLKTRLPQLRVNLMFCDTGFNDYGNLHPKSYPLSVDCYRADSVRQLTSASQGQVSRMHFCSVSTAIQEGPAQPHYWTSVALAPPLRARQ